MLSDYLDSLIEETIRGLIVTAAIRPASATALRRSDNPQLIIWEPLLAPVSDHGVDLTI
jgi:hypothetical protein